MALGVNFFQILFGAHFLVAGTLTLVLPHRKLWSAVAWVKELHRRTRVAVGVAEVASASGLMLDTVFGLDWIAVVAGLCLACILAVAGSICRRQDDKDGVEFIRFAL